MLLIYWKIAPFVIYCLLLDLFFGSSQMANWFLSYGNYKFFWYEIWQVYTWNIPGIYKVWRKNVSCGIIWCYSMSSLCRSVGVCPTCLPITWRHGNPIFRSKRAGLQLLEFPFSVFCTGCTNDQEWLTGPKLRHVFTRHMGARKPDVQVKTRWLTCTRIPFCDVLCRL